LKQTKFKYGELYDIAPTLGIDCPKGKILITGICHPSYLPDFVDVRAWVVGDPEFDWDLQTQPWYFFEYVSDIGDFPNETFDLPEFALEETFHQYRKNEIKKYRSESFTSESEMDAIR
jgi:hypothetical protein